MWQNNDVLESSAACFPEREIRMSDGRWVLLIAGEVGGTESVSDQAMERLCQSIQEEGYRVVRTSTPEDGLALVKSDPSFRAILLDWDLYRERAVRRARGLKGRPKCEKAQQQGSHLFDRRPDTGERVATRGHETGA